MCVYIYCVTLDPCTVCANTWDVELRAGSLLPVADTKICASRRHYHILYKQIMLFAFWEVTLLTPWALRCRICSSYLSQTDDFHGTLHETYMGTTIVGGGRGGE